MLIKRAFFMGKIGTKWESYLKTFIIRCSIYILLLNVLRDDDNETVRCSATHNLNDIAKDNADIVVQFAQKFGGESANGDKFIKHGYRTVLTQEPPVILSFYGLSPEDLSVTNLVLECDALHVGDSLAFEFNITNVNENTRKVQLEYAINYRKNNG